MTKTRDLADLGGGFIQAGTGAVQRTVESKLQDVASVKDFGAVGNGVADDTTAVQNAFTAGTSFLPAGTYLTTLPTQLSIPGKTYGLGTIKTADGSKSAPYSSIVSSRPSTTPGNSDTILTAFNGDFSKSQFAVSHAITGSDTLGTPTTGYLYTPEAYPHYTYLYNSSGWNQSTNGNTGRTGAAAYRVNVAQYGQGDLACFNGSAFVTGTKAGSTHFLANPAATLFNGDMSAGANGVFLNPYETICHDNGYDVACVGLVNNFVRTNSTGAKTTVWMGYRAQSQGSATCDAFLSATGKWVTGLDLALTDLDFGTNKAAISLKAGDRIYFNNASIADGNLEAGWRTNVFNGDYITFEPSTSIINFVRGGTSRFQIGTDMVIVANTDFAVAPTGNGATAAIIRSRQSGFGLPTGVRNTASFDTATVTVTQLAQYVAGLVDRLHASTSGAHALIAD